MGVPDRIGPGRRLASLGRGQAVEKTKGFGRQPVIVCIMQQREKLAAIMQETARSAPDEQQSRLVSFRLARCTNKLFSIDMPARLAAKGDPRVTKPVASPQARALSTRQGMVAVRTEGVMASTPCGKRCKKQRWPGANRGRPRCF